MLIVELDGPRVEVDELFAIVERVCEQCGAVTTEVARDQGQRERIWKGRKAAFAAMGRVSPNYYVQDGVVPRTKLPEVLRRIRDLEERSGLRIGNVFHAGDGNLHPADLLRRSDSRPGRARRGGRLRNPPVLHRGGRRDHRRAWRRRRQESLHAEDVRARTISTRCSSSAAPSIPPGICNPGKVFPTPRLCGEVPGPYRQHPIERAGLAERY